MTSNFKFNHDTTSFDLQNAHSLAMAAQLAYQDETAIKNKVMNEWQMKNFRFFQSDVDTQGFVMSNDNMMVVTFRGTNDIEDWITNLNLDLRDGPLDGQVHHGFNTALSSVWQTITETLESFRENQPKSLWVTGHSLGAALATLTVARFLDEDRPVDGLYTFGQPRTGDRNFCRNFNSDFQPFAFRFVNNNDIVTRIPPRPRYRHLGTLKYFTDAGKLVDDIKWWNRFLDRMHGRFEDILVWGTDGIKDHSMDDYANLVKKAM